LEQHGSTELTASVSWRERRPWQRIFQILTNDDMMKNIFEPLFSVLRVFCFCHAGVSPIDDTPTKLRFRNMMNKVIPHGSSFQLKEKYQ